VCIACQWAVKVTVLLNTLATCTLLLHKQPFKVFIQNHFIKGKSVIAPVQATHMQLQPSSRRTPHIQSNQPCRMVLHVAFSLQSVCPVNRHIIVLAQHPQSPQSN